MGNSSQPWGERQGSGQRVEPVRVREVGRPQLPAGQTVPENRRLPGMQGPQPAARPQRPGTSRPATASRMEAAQAKAERAAQGTKSSSVRTGRPAKPSRFGGAFGKGNAAAIALGIINAADDSRLTDAQRRRKYEVVNPERGNDLLTKLQEGRLGTSNSSAKPKPSKPGSDGRYVPGKEKSKFTDSEAAKPAEKQPARPVRSASQQPTTAVRNPSPKAKASTPSKPAPKASETYRDGGKGLYQGSKEYRDKVGGSGNPLLNRFRKEMGLDQATGQRADAPTVAKEAPKQEPKAASKSGGEGVKDSLKIDQAASKADAGRYFKDKPMSPSKGQTANGTRLAQMTPDDRQQLRDYADTLKKQGGPAAQRELDRLNKQYSKYGMSFGKLKSA